MPMLDDIRCLMMPYTPFIIDMLAILTPTALVWFAYWLQFHYMAPTHTTNDESTDESTDDDNSMMRNVTMRRRPHRHQHDLAPPTPDSTDTSQSPDRA